MELMSMNKKQMNIFGKIYSIIVVCATIMLFVVSCDYATVCQVGSGTIQVDSLANVKWSLVYSCMNANGQRSKLKFVSEGLNSHIKNFDINDTKKKCFVVCDDSLNVSICDTLLLDSLKVATIDVDTYISKAMINNTDTINFFETNLGWFYKLQRGKKTFIKIYPCGYLKREFNKQVQNC